jgi:EAL domain-containing protein (putative c-di-GMP-specific phosphodiesterase class I)
VPEWSSQDIRDNLESTFTTARRCGIEPPRLVVELKHEVTLNDPATLADCLKDARREGVRISIGDFGSDRAGLALLDRYHP